MAKNYEGINEAAARAIIAHLYKHYPHPKRLDWLFGEYIPEIIRKQQPPPKQ